MYDKNIVSKLTCFTYFVLKFIERLSSEKDVWKYNCKITFKWHMYITFGKEEEPERNEAF